MLNANQEEQVPIFVRKNMCELFFTEVLEGRKLKIISIKYDIFPLQEVDHVIC
jgi:hypothetical protein